MNQFHANVEHRILTLLKQKDLILNSKMQTREKWDSPDFSRGDS